MKGFLVCSPMMVDTGPSEPLFFNEEAMEKDDKEEKTESHEVLQRRSGNGKASSWMVIFKVVPPMIKIQKRLNGRKR